MAINFISSKDYDKTRTIHTKSDNTEMIIGSETDEITEELFNSLLQRYQNGLDELIREVIFFYSVDLLHYKLHKTSLNCGGLYIDTPKCL